MASPNDSLTPSRTSSSEIPDVARTLMQGVDASVFIIGPDLRPNWSSEPDGSVLGVDPGDWGPGTLANLVHPTDREWVKQKRQEILATPGATMRGKVTICPPNGEQSTVLLTATNRFADPEINGLVLTTQPFTASSETLHAESDEWTHRAGVLADLAEDLRSTVRQVATAADELSGDPHPSRRDSLATIAAAVDTLDDLLNDVSDLANIAAGTLELANIVFSPARLVDEVAAAYGPVCVTKGVDLRISIDAALPSRVKGDPERLSRVLHHLVSDAVQTTQIGFVHLEAWIDNASRIGFRIGDTGGGLPGSTQTAMSEPQSAEIDPSSGRALGIAIARQTIELMDGTLSFQTGERGSTFWFDLPFGHARRLDDRTLRSADPTPTEPQGEPKSLHLLVVDDSDVNLLLSSSQLTRLGHTFDTASSGPDALRMLLDNTYDIVLMDWHMPGMDGLDTTRHYRSGHDPHHTLPIITMTASAMAGDRQRCLDAGASDYLSKPVSLDDLETMLSRWSAGGSPAEEIGSSAPARSTIDALVADLGDIEVVVSVVEAYIDLLPGHSEAAAAAFARGDLATVHRSAHTLKSTAIMLGIDDLAKTCLELETSVVEESDDIDVALEAFLRACQNSMPGLHVLAVDLSDAAALDR